MTIFFLFLRSSHLQIISQQTSQVAMQFDSFQNHILTKYLEVTNMLQHLSASAACAMDREPWWPPYLDGDPPKILGH